MKKEIPILSGKELGQQGIALSRNRVITYPIHGHAYYELLVYDPFCGEIAVNGTKLDPHIPTAILLTPSDLHSTTIWGDSCADCFKLRIKCSEMDRISRYESRLAVTQAPAQVAFLRALCEQAEECGEDEAYRLKCVELLVLTLQKNAGRLSFPPKSVSLMRAATDILQQRFCEPLTLEAVAAELHVSVPYLSSLFARYADMGFSEYLTDRRLHYAAVLLQNGANVTEACLQSGYRNLSHFIRSFKKKYHVTPAKFAR